MDLDVYEHLVTRALELGIPPDICAELFALPEDTCVELLRHIRVEKFGTSDLAGYLEGLQWRALEHADRMLRNGSPEQAGKIVNAVFGRQLQAAGRRPSGELEEQRARLMAMFGRIREDTAAPAVAAGRFVLGNTTVDRRANREEDDDDV